MAYNQTKTDDRGQTLRTLLAALGLALGFLFWAMFVFLTVGDKGQPTWDYGVIRDVPGLSPYSTASPRPLPMVPRFLHEQARLSPQHVDEQPETTNEKQGDIP